MKSTTTKPQNMITKFGYCFAGSLSYEIECVKCIYQYL